MRYRIDEWVWRIDSYRKRFFNGELYRFVVVDTHFNNQAVAEFPVKVPENTHVNAEICEVLINDARMARKMAHMVCEQMNRESGYQREAEDLETRMARLETKLAMIKEVMGQIG